MLSQLCLAAQSCLILCDPMDCSPPGSSIHGILQARILEWIAMPCFRGSSQPRVWTQVSRLLHWWWVLYHWSHQRIRKYKGETNGKVRKEKHSNHNLKKKITNGRERGKDPVWDSLEEKKPLLTRTVVGGVWDANKYQTLKPLEASVRGEIMWAEYYSKK